MDENKPANAVPNSGQGIQEIERLTKKGLGLEIRQIETDGLGPGLPGKVPVLFNLSSSAVASVKDHIEAFRIAPVRRDGEASVTTLQSFIDLCSRHKDADSVLFAETKWPDLSLLGVMDYHKADGTARWGKHLIRYKFPVTDELKIWMNMNGQMLEQAEFAMFLENHAAELSAPMDGEVEIYERLFKERMSTPTELIGLSRNLEIRAGMHVKRSERMASGERTVEFTEDHTNAKGEKVDIPGIFIVSVPAFLDGDPVRIPARLRYRIAGGTIKWCYQLYRPEVFIRDRVKEDIRKAAEETGLPAFEGQPEN